ncbi:uncharacterized protein B0H18DRAFT_252692 [Fomitopsis serialis]|uniref:uncharacterized protein n=1 Tax=Fomitopsis serialis TaxID=139415 RepID=UPI00200830CE|nr:uncharacterized protein B0H18DRAFT_252692 [Neoantrodia serialis]KAH9928263.1 hypothetical protein B0H18DRAFT_252692 [Neoantrodia serialis]
MDSDDERILQEEEAESARNVFELPQRPPVWIRTYEREEFAIRREYVLRTLDAKEQGIPLDSSGDIRGMWRIRRLWTSVAGFYEGKLDLAGRSERRWYSLKRRFDRFMVDVASLRTHILTRPPTVLDGSCEALLLIVSSPSALNDFKHKYKLGYVDLPEILAIPEMMDALYPGCPKAVIQKLFLTDLPPELLLYIFELAHIDDARALGATCHALNDLSLPYIYQTRRLVLHVDPTYLEKALEEFSDMDRRYLTHLSARMRTNLLADFGFLLARDDILKRVEHLVIQSLWTPNLASAAGFNARREAHSTFFSPIWKQIEATLSAVTNLREFNIEKIVITQNMIHAIASLRGLQTLSIHNCPVYQVAPWEMPPPSRP